MSNPLSGASVICFESEAFFAICEYVATDVRNKIQVKDKWIGEKAAMDRLGIKSKATLQKLRKNGDIVFTQPMKKVILYDAESIDNYLAKHSTKWVSEKNAMRMLGIKSKIDIQKLRDQIKIVFKEIHPGDFIYTVKSIEDYINKNR